MPELRVRSLTPLETRVRQEFLDMPGLRLTEPQARRLWTLDAPQCSAVLSHLVDSGFLARTPDGTFVRLDVAAPARVPAPRRPRRSVPAA